MGIYLLWVWFTEGVEKGYFVLFEALNNALGGFSDYAFDSFPEDDDIISIDCNGNGTNYIFVYHMHKKKRWQVVELRI